MTKMTPNCTPEVARQPELDRLMNQLEETHSFAVSLESRLSRLDGELHGEERAEDSGDKAPERSGRIGALQDKAESITADLRRIEEIVSQLEKLV